MTTSASTSFYRTRTGGGYESLPTTGSPWGRGSQHGGPPAALLTRAIEGLPDAAGRVAGRLTIELLGPVPVGPLDVTATVVRPGRSVALAEATLVDLTAGRPVATASAWLLPDVKTDVRPVGPAPHHRPASGELHEQPAGWHRGYLDTVEWRWIAGAVGEPGPALVWMRPEVTLLPDEEWTPLTRLMACADSASGASSELDPASWRFLNTELTVHVLRPPVGEWLCLDARTELSSGSVGLATSAVYDQLGLVARTAQTLLIGRR